MAYNFAKHVLQKCISLILLLVALSTKLCISEPAHMILSLWPPITHLALLMLDFMHYSTKRAREIERAAIEQDALHFCHSLFILEREWISCYHSSPLA